MEAKAGKVLIDAIIHAPIEEVWRAWTEPVLIMGWFGSDPEGTGLQAALDVRPGGRFEITFCNSDGTEHTCCGIYKDVQKYTLLSFSWEWKSEPGVVSLVTVLLSPQGHNTQMEFEHANVGTASAHNYLKGWKDTFFKLERMLAG